MSDKQVVLNNNSRIFKNSFIVSVSPMDATAAHCHDTLKNGCLGNALLAHVNQWVEVSQGVFMLSRKEADFVTLVKI